MTDSLQEFCELASIELKKYLPPELYPRVSIAGHYPNEVIRGSAIMGGQRMCFDIDQREAMLMVEVPDKKRFGIFTMELLVRLLITSERDSPQAKRAVEMLDEMEPQPMKLRRNSEKFFGYMADRLLRKWRDDQANNPALTPSPSSAPAHTPDPPYSAH